MQEAIQVPDIRKLYRLNPQLKAVFWDMDGTLLDTEPIHIKAIKQLLSSSLEQQEIRKLDLESSCIGQTDKNIFNKLALVSPPHNMTLPLFLEKKEEIFQTLIRLEKPESILKDEVLKLIQQITNANLTQCIVTSSERKTADFLVQKFNLESHFKYMICREDTTQNKPAPDPYLLALKNLNIPAKQALVFEDSLPGSCSAESAGITVIRARWY